MIHIEVDPALLARLRAARVKDGGSVAGTYCDGGVSTDYGDACDELARAVLAQVEPLAQMVLPARGTWGDLMDILGSLGRARLPNVDGIDLDTSTTGEVRFTLRGRGITAAEIDAVQNAALEWLPVGVGAIVRRGDGDA